MSETTVEAAVDLDRLEQLRAAIGDSPAFRVVGFDRAEDAEWVYARFDDGGRGIFAECYGADAADLIAAALDALPALLSLARRATALEQRVQALAEELESFTVNRNPAPGSYGAGVVAAFVNVAARLRNLVDGGEQS